MKQTVNRVSAFRREHPRGWAFGWAMTMAGLSMVIGLGVTVYDGALNPLPRPRAFFIVVGLVAFYVPGMLMGLAAVGLRRGWAGLVRAGSLAALAQGAMALVPTFGHPAVGPFSPVLVIEGLLWTAADVYVALLLWRAAPWVVGDAAAKAGFEVGRVDAEVPEADVA